MHSRQGKEAHVCNVLAETEAVVEGLLTSSYTLVTQREPSNQVVLCSHMSASCMARHDV